MKLQLETIFFKEAIIFFAVSSIGTNSDLLEELNAEESPPVSEEGASEGREDETGLELLQEVRTRKKWQNGFLHMRCHPRSLKSHIIINLDGEENTRSDIVTIGILWTRGRIAITFRICARDNFSKEGSARF